MATPAMPTEDFNTAYNSEDPCTHVLIVEGGKWRESFVDLYASDMYRFESGDLTPDHHAYMFKSGRVWDTVNGWRWGQTASVEAPQGRTFETGAYRDTDNGKLDYEAFLCPRVLESYAQYMHKNRIQSDGKVRDGDNWQKGIPLNVYIKSLFRHFVEVWKLHRMDCTSKSQARERKEQLLEHLNAILFNTQGYIHELLKQKEEE